MTIVSPEPPITIQRSHRAAIIVYPRTPILVVPAWRTIFVRPRTPILVKPLRRAVWQEKNWVCRAQRRGHVYLGNYQMMNRRSNTRLLFPGRIVEGRSGISAFVNDPPARLRQHPNAACFYLSRGTWFRVHWDRPPTNPDEAILYIEKVLDEVVNRPAA